MPVSQVTAEPVKIIKIRPARPLPLVPPEIDPRTLTRETANKLLNENPVYVCLSWEDHLSNAKFDQDKKAYLEQVLNILDFWEKQEEDGKNTKAN